MRGFRCSLALSEGLYRIPPEGGSRQYRGTILSGQDVELNNEGVGVSLFCIRLLPQRDQEMLATHEEGSVRYRGRGHDVIVQRVYCKQFKHRAGLDNTDFPLLGRKVKSLIS